MLPSIDVERLINRHKNAVYRQMVRVCGNRDDAEDVLVEAMLRAYKAKDQLRDEESFAGWLSIIGRRVCGRIRKKEALIPFLNLEDQENLLQSAAPSADDLLNSAEMQRCIHAAIEALPDAYRQVYIRREIDGVEASEVADELGLTVANVKSRLHRARAKVREFLDNSLCTVG
ncbi:MAG: RNA polymerase sigma factor [Fimbriimonadales bacterium]